jgi:hypothetical protein
MGDSKSIFLNQSPSYGLEQSWDKFVDPNLSIKTPIKGLYLTG